MHSIFERIDKSILVLALLLMGAGIIFVYSSSFAIAEQRFGGANFFVYRHLIRALIALICFVVFLNLDYHRIGQYSHLLYFGSIVFLVWVLVMPDHSAVNGAKRWVNLGFFKFQASEFARIALIILLAVQGEKVGDAIREQKVFIQQLIKIGIICALIFVEPNFSTSAIVAIIGLAILFVAGAQLKHIGVVFASAIPILVFAAFAMPYRRHRILAYLHNTSGAKKAIGYQTHQSLIGIGHGGVFGLGLGNGEQKFFFLPECHTDFMFSMIGEEMGFVGLTILMGTFFFIIWRGMQISIAAPDKLGRLLAFGLTLVLAMYIILHAFVNTGIVPTTGVPLPFFSYGGMSLIFTMISLGILLNISSQSYRSSSGGRKNR